MTNSTHTKNLDQEELLLQAFSEANDVQESLSVSALSEELREVEKRYVIRDLLGEGALKKVYLGYDELLDRDVALAKMKTEGHLDDFFNEARLASRLEHPYISPIYDMGYDEEGEAFFAMKLYEGMNLYEEVQLRRKNNDLELSWVLNIFSKVCEAVAFAHGKGVLHLDIKPSNIRVDDFGEVLLCDWGISRVIGAGKQDESSLVNMVPLVSRATLVGEVRGTPGFMAPEQINKQNCDEKTDVYGLGALLFDLLKGEPPRHHKSFGICVFPKEVQSIALKALHDDVNSRYDSVNQLLDDVNNYNQGLVTQAENAGSWQVLYKWLKRNSKTMIIVAFNLGLIITLVSFYIRDVNQSNKQLELTLGELQAEREEKTRGRLEQADRYFKQGFDTYANSVSQFDYDEDDISLALEMLVRAVALDSEHLSSWGLLGNLRVLRDDYSNALECYEKAGEKYKIYHTILKDYLAMEPLSNKVENELELIRRINPLKDRRFRNHLVFKGIHRIGNQEELFQFSLGSLAIVNKLEKLHYKYDEKTKILDLSQNILRTVYPLKTLRIEGLILRGHLGKGHELYNLRNIPLRYLDLSHSKVVYLDRLLNVEIEELSLEGAPVGNVTQVKDMPKLKKLNVYGIPAGLRILGSCVNLEEVVCSEAQATQLRSFLPTTVKITIKPD